MNKDTNCPHQQRFDRTRRIPVQAKIAAAWTSFMFLYIYVDFFNLYKPGVVDGILNGLVLSSTSARPC